MNVLVFGASGATGREVVKHALERGYCVAAFVRDPGKFEIKHAKLALIVGDVTDYASVERAVAGQDAVASALGSGNSLSAHPALTDGVQNIIRAMDHAGVRRLVYLSMLGVGGSARQLGLVDRYIVLPLLLRNVGGRSRERGSGHHAKRTRLGDRASRAIDEQTVHREISKWRGYQGARAPGVDFAHQRGRFHGETIDGRSIRARNTGGAGMSMCSAALAEQCMHREGTSLGRALSHAHPPAGAMSHRSP